MAEDAERVRLLCCGKVSPAFSRLEWALLTFALAAAAVITGLSVAVGKTILSPPILYADLARGACRGPERAHRGGCL